MTGAPTINGILTDKEGTGFPGCRIQKTGDQQDQPFTVLNFVQRYLDAIPKKARVCYQLTDGKISKIWEDKEQGTLDTGTSPKTPVVAPPDLKTVEGQIVVLDVPAHKVTLKTKDGQQHSFIWGPALHDKMSQLKQWWFVKLTGEYEKDVDLWRLASKEYFKRPDDWPASPARSTFQPRNEKAIILQTALKVAADVWIARGFCEGTDPKYSDAMAEITQEAIKTAEAISKAAGLG